MAPPIIDLPNQRDSVVCVRGQLIIMWDNQLRFTVYKSTATINGCYLLSIIDHFDIDKIPPSFDEAIVFANVNITRYQ